MRSFQNVFSGLSQGLINAPFRAVLMIRLTTFLHPIVHWILAASPIRLPVFLLGTAIGILPGVLAIVLLGQSFVNWWEEYSWWLVGGVVLLTVGWFGYKKRMA